MHRGALLSMLLAVATPFATTADRPNRDSVVATFLRVGLGEGEAFRMLQELCTAAPHRLSGSKGAEAAVELTRQMMLDRGFDNVHLEKLLVPRWERGPSEEAYIIQAEGAEPTPLAVCALGGSVATPDGGLTTEVLEVKSFDELRSAGTRARGKIVFFNRPMDPTLLNTFRAYGGAVDQRSRGAIEAAKAGAVGVLVRSMTLARDDVPHTGAMNYADTVAKIPAAAISTISADRLSSMLAADGRLRVRMKLTCRTLPDVESANVVGDITGWEYPNEVILVSGHLDAWDKGMGAHDDGAGCVQAIEALRLFKKLGIRTRRTLRAVMFMNEENGLRGGREYPKAREREGETHIAAIESDRGGFAPRGFSVEADSGVLERVMRWKPTLESLNAGRIIRGGSGADISFLARAGVPSFGLLVEDHRYFDYHHSDNDTIDKVNPRELQMGAIVQAVLMYLISEEGL